MAMTIEELERAQDIVRQDIVHRCEELLTLAESYKVGGGRGFLKICLRLKTITYVVSCGFTYFSYYSELRDESKLSYDTNHTSLREIQTYLIRGRRQLLSRIKDNERDLRMGVKDAIKNAPPPFLLSPVRQTVNKIKRAAFILLVLGSGSHLLWNLFTMVTK